MGAPIQGLARNVRVLTVAEDINASPLNPECRQREIDYWIGRGINYVILCDDDAGRRVIYTRDLVEARRIVRRITNPKRATGGKKSAPVPQATVVPLDQILAPAKPRARLVHTPDLDLPRKAGPREPFTGRADQVEAREADRGRDTGRYQGGYRTYRNGTEREDFGSDR